MCRYCTTTIAPATRGNGTRGGGILLPDITNYQDISNNNQIGDKENYSYCHMYKERLFGIMFQAFEWGFCVMV